MKKNSFNRFPAYLQLVKNEPSKVIPFDKTDSSSDLSDRVTDTTQKHLEQSTAANQPDSKPNLQSTVVWEHVDHSDSFDETFVLTGADDAPIWRIRLVSSGFGNGILCLAA